MGVMELNVRLDDLPGPLIVYDADGTLINANQPAFDLLGVRSEELIGSSASAGGWQVTDAAGWPDAENLHPALAAIRSQQPQRGVVARAIRPDGAEVWLLVDSVPVMRSAGGISHVMTTLSDLTRIFNDARLPRPGYGDAAVAAITEQLAGSRLDPDAILKTVTSSLSKLRNGTWVAVLLNKDPRTVRVVAANDADPQVAEYIENSQMRPNPPSFATSTRVIETGEPVLVPSIPYGEFMATLNAEMREFLARNEPPSGAAGGYFTSLVVAMRARGAVVGTLGIFQRHSSNPLTERDIRWLQVIADRTGLAAENAQLYVDAVSRLERLTALRSVRMAISGTKDLRLTLQVILDQAVVGLGVAAADILLVDEGDGTLGIAASTGFQSTSIPDYRLPVAEELPGGVLTGRRIETVTALGAFSQFRRRSLFAREGFKAYGAVPVIAGEKLVGVLEVFHRSQLQPDQEWLEFLDALGSEAALAIDRVALLGHHQQGRREDPIKPKVAAPNLSRMEREILVYLVEGLPNRVIAEKVHLSPNTIKFHVGQMLDKVGVSNRTELARKATQEGWL
jgi:PAS domain S-box-containing protein